MTTRPYKQPISVLVVVYTRDLQFLLLQRTDRPDYWQSVTGSCELDEHPIQTAQRELSEETGLTTDQLHDWQHRDVYEIYPHWRHRYAPGTTHNTEHRFSLQLDQPCSIQISPQEHLSYCWLDWQDAAAKVFSPSNRDAILRLATCR